MAGQTFSAAGEIGIIGANVGTTTDGDPNRIWVGGAKREEKREEEKPVLAPAEWESGACVEKKKEKDCGTPFPMVFPQKKCRTR